MRGSRAEALFLAAVLTAFSLMLISGHGKWAGDELVELTPTHGINGGDLFVFGLWLASMAALWRLGLEPSDRRRIAFLVTHLRGRYVSGVRRRSSQGRTAVVRMARAARVRIRTRICG